MKYLHKTKSYNMTREKKVGEDINSYSTKASAISPDS